MSFSSEVKRELCCIDLTKKCCQKAELAGIVAFCGFLDGADFILRTENKLVAERIQKLFSVLFGFAPVCRETSRGAKGRMYTLRLSEKNGLYKVLAQLGLCRGQMVKFAADPFLVQEDCCAKSYLRGAFLGGGSVNAPQRSYHLEIETHYFGLSHDLSSLLSDLAFEVKTVMRKGNYVTYLKDSEKIGDILGMMGATSSMMELYNAKIEKEVKNTVNRRVNCETANITKTANAAALQIKSIERLMAKKGSDSIPERLRELAELRLEYPEASLAELGEMLSPPISKSGVNHRMKKLMDMEAML